MRWKIVHVLMMVAKPAQALVEACLPWSSTSMAVIGTIVSSTLFSWTWNPHKKKPYAQVVRAESSNLFCGLRKTMTDGGKTARDVGPKAAWASVEGE